MTRRTTTIITTTVVAAGVTAAALAFGLTSFAGGGDDGEAPITGDALTKASAAALAHTGGGTVSETEVGDEDSMYEVEVTLDDGSQVDVQLDENFRVVGADADVENEPGDD
jgi:hypothetical protein